VTGSGSTQALTPAWECDRGLACAVRRVEGISGDAGLLALFEQPFPMRESINPLFSISDPFAGATAPLGGPASVSRRPCTVLVFRTGDEGAAETLRGIAHYQQVHGDRSALVDDQQWTADEWRTRLAEECDGVISQNTSAALIGACAERGLPLVAVDDAPVHPGVSRIRPDNVAIGAMGAEFFLDRGFRSFAFVGQESSGWASDRQTGFVEAVRLGGHKAEVLAMTPDGGVGEVRALARWLRELPKPAGVMACDDQSAVRMVEAAREAGCLVPEEVAVLGADNDVVRCELATPTLSSVDPGLFQVGYLAAEHLARRMADRGVGACDLRLDPAEIVVRRSTDVVAIPDRAVATAARYIAEHACEGLTVSEVLPHAAVSRAQLEKKFRQYLGRSPQAEIRRVQVARIRQLLADTDLPLKSIAGLTGFAYMEYLCVVFRRLTGETPGTYRRRCLRGGPVPGRGKSGSRK
jgi:LacI family transcriptional regulator